MNCFLDPMDFRCTKDSRKGENKIQTLQTPPKHDDGQTSNLQLLQLVQENDSILHTPIEEMSIEEICSNETKQIVANMIYSIRPEQLKTAKAPLDDAGGMAANQWNIKKRIFLFCPYGSSGFIKVIFNPTYKPVMIAQQLGNHFGTASDQENMDVNVEACFSVPFAYGMVERYKAIEISYVDEQGVRHVNEQLSGGEARAWQHETDHLNGILYSNRRSGINKGPNCIELRRFQTKEEFDKYFPK